MSKVDPITDVMAGVAAKNPNGHGRAAFAVITAYNPGTKKREYLMGRRGAHYESSGLAGKGMLFGGRADNDEEHILDVLKRELIEEIGPDVEDVLDLYPDEDFVKIHEEFTPADRAEEGREHWQDDFSTIFMLDVPYEDFQTIYDIARMTPREENDEFGGVGIINQEQLLEDLRSGNLNMSFPHEDHGLKKAAMRSMNVVKKAGVIVSDTSARIGETIRSAKRSLGRGFGPS